MSDRRRVNGPAGTTQPPFYHDNVPNTPICDRDTAFPRPVYLKTGVTPSASGSAYLEIEEGRNSAGFGLKLICTVYGPRSLPRSAPFSPHMVISTHVKYTPFATQKRRGYLRDSSERDLSLHLETALRGAIIADRWPKSGVDVIVTVIEGDRRTTVDDGIDDWNTMTVLGGCITVASAAIADAGIDCVDTVTGGVAALVIANDNEAEPLIVIDPILSEHDTVLAACCVAYLAGRDEMTNLWYRGSLQPADLTARRALIARAIMASKGTSKMLSSSLIESLPSC
ncbi:3'-5'-exoribonuclease [Claviceps lovelessii]|nr:3'-5'-exoribonuclease [Claviceps lovelessii]